MKRFILKTILFLLPVLLAFSITEIFYSTDKGDLLRIGYIADIYGYDRMDIFKEEYERERFYTKISEIDLTQKHHFTILNVGDSFSQQGNVGYLNYLAENLGIDVLDYDRNLAENQSPIETLTGVLNGDLLDNISVDYVILETVERNFVQSAINLNRRRCVSIDSLTRIMEQKKARNREMKKDRLFSSRMKNFFKTNYHYCLDDNAFNSQTYKVKTSKTMFSANKNVLLFFRDDLDILPINNDQQRINSLHTELNYLSEQLTKRNIRLIVLTAPDKYDLYYDDIVNQSKYREPLFFDHFRAVKNKEYLFVDTKLLLTPFIQSIGDLYYFDDTHWSPKAAQIVAGEIERCMSIDIN